jgi:hypothetical protein
MKYFLRNITGKGIKFFESDSYIYIAFRYEKNNFIILMFYKYDEIIFKGLYINKKLIEIEYFYNNNALLFNDEIILLNSIEIYSELLNRLYPINV